MHELSKAGATLGPGRCPDSSCFPGGPAKGRTGSLGSTDPSPLPPGWLLMAPLHPPGSPRRGRCSSRWPRRW